MNRQDKDITVTRLNLPQEADSLVLAADIALVLKPGDVVALHGELGMGKSTIARHIIRSLAGDHELEVPSPTFTLVQDYEINSAVCGSIQLRHCDFYRLGELQELEELGLVDGFTNTITLIEWPQIAAELLPEGTLHIRLDEDQTGNGRIAEISGAGGLLGRIKRSISIRRFLNDSWQENVTRQNFVGDASARSYELVRYGNDTRLLMNAPPLADGPPIKDGLPYSRIAHLAEDIIPFIAIGKTLKEAGFAAPAIHDFNLDEGLVLLEYMGNGTIIDDERKPISERYLASVEVLAAMHEINWSKKIDIAGGVVHTIPPYDRGAMMIEAELLLDWYIPHYGTKAAGQEERSQFTAIWDELIEIAGKSEQSLVLRDFHSPNIIWQSWESGNNRTGLIDFQDAMFGPAAYDLASIAQDARVDVTQELENALIEHYISLRYSADKGFDEDNFRQAYAIMTALRATKILGIFVRLDRRDKKPAYLAHLPRMTDYLFRSLEHPVLAKYKDWLEKSGIAGL